KAFENLFLYGFVININRVIGGAAARNRFITNQTGIAQAPYIYSKSVVEVSTPLLACQLADTIHSGWVARTVLGCSFLLCIRTKYSNGTWPEHFLYLFI